jgi:hypothetical protein
MEQDIVFEQADGLVELEDAKHATHEHEPKGNGKSQGEFKTQFHTRSFPTLFSLLKNGPINYCNFIREKALYARILTN